MKFILTTLSMTIVLSTFAQEPAAPNRSYLRLKCGAEVEVPSQPCGGFNSRELDLNIDANKGAYKEFSSYGGCYGVSGTSFGRIELASKVGDIISFKLVRKGYMQRGMPYVDDYKFVKTAKLNVTTGVLKLSRDNNESFYSAPSVLKCELR